MSKLKQQYEEEEEEEEETMLMDKTRFDNEVYATGLQVATAVNYYMDRHSYVQETLMTSLSDPGL